VAYTAETLAAGSTKLAGEVAVMEEDPNSLILRTTGDDKCMNSMPHTLHPAPCALHPTP
jgi:hypothetical protein